MAIPQLETTRLILKGVTLENAADYEKYFVDYEVIRHLSNVVPWPYPKNGVREFLENIALPQQGKTQWLWGIFLKANPSELIGAIDLGRVAKPTHRGFWLGRKFWGQGYMTEAIVAVTDCAFKELNFEKLIFGNAVGNQASRRVKEKTAARFIGTQKAIFVDPAHSELEMWELTKEDWLQHAQASNSK